MYESWFPIDRLSEVLRSCKESIACDLLCFKRLINSVINRVSRRNVVLITQSLFVSRQDFAKTSARKSGPISAARSITLAQNQGIRASHSEKVSFCCSEASLECLLSQLLLFELCSSSSPTAHNPVTYPPLAPSITILPPTHHPVNAYFPSDKAFSPSSSRPL